MATIAGMLKRFENLDTDTLCEQVLAESKEPVANLNAEQLSKGISSTGTPFAPYRNEAYADYKHRKNPQPGYGNPDYILTGSFVSKIVATVSGDGYQITSTDEKTAELVNRDPDNSPFQLSEKFKAEAIRTAVMPAFKAKIEAATGLLMK
jgi:hypothetical protein